MDLLLWAGEASICMERAFSMLIPCFLAICGLCPAALKSLTCGSVQGTFEPHWFGFCNRHNRLPVLGKFPEDFNDFQSIYMGPPHDFITLGLSQPDQLTGR